MPPSAPSLPNWPVAPVPVAVAVPEPDPLVGTAGFIWTFRICVYGGLLVALWLGGPVVRTGAVASMVFTLLADRAGALRHVLHLASLPLLLLLSATVGLPLGNWIATWLDMAAPVAVALGVLLVVVAGLSCTRCLGNAVTKHINKRRYAYVFNRVVGSLLGLGEGALLAVVLCWVFAVFGPALHLHILALAQRQPALARQLACFDRLRVALRDDPLGQRLDEHNPLRNIPVVMTVAALGEVSAEPGLFWRIVKDGQLDELLAIPVVRAHYDRIKADEGARTAIEHRDLRALLMSNHFSRALNDRKLCSALAERWPNIRARIAQEDIELAHRFADTLDPAARARYQQAVRRANEYGVEEP